ncbi:translation initiation factor IF-2 subunit beta [Halobellus clavatus]|jgi:translation initiation factor 2 subunit 2|uniref:Translation initiation factor 2 subunit beta n=1 Tax=Halobellus clavatus TaxID=660517 RepID=A0A1H3D9P1_9EURY|nr:translation initiation factor IF-2 subunit beta [Halobellus clavatus]SDX62868.1 translation initiation factor 2 subunit 2 [Halobellus clavatus]
MDYQDQLDRALEQSPDIAEGGERFEVPDPDVRPEGNVTVWENFEATYDRLARDPDHLVRFMQSELGTSAQIDDRGRARFTGDFKQRRVESALETYVDDFVTCSECASPDTRLVEERGTTVLKCDACGALSSVPDL